MLNNRKGVCALKIIHTADFHLDSPFSFLTVAKRNERRNELILAFKNMVSWALDNEVAAVIIAGDFFDSSSVSAKTKSIVWAEIEKAKDINFYYLSGNHDDETAVFANQELPNNLKLFTDNFYTYYEGGVAISGIALNNSNYQNFYNNIQLNKEFFNIVVMHGEIVNTNHLKDSNSISLKRLNKNINYLALGHYHAHATGQLEDGGIYAYSGCLEPRGFDELGDKGFVVVDINDNGKATYSFVKQNIRTFHEVKVDITNCVELSSQEHAIAKAIVGIETKDLVKVVLTGEYLPNSRLDVEYLEKYLAQKFYFAKIYNHSKLKINLEELKYDASLKGEFIRTVLDQKNLSQELAQDVIMCGVSALLGQEV